MTEYSVSSDNAKNFTLAIKDKLLGNLIYDNWFSLKSEIILSDNSKYKIEPSGFWGTTLELKSNDQILLNFKLGFNGNIVLNTAFNGIEGHFIFRQKGILKSSYVLLDKEQQQLLIIQPDFKWNKFNYDYKISASASFEEFQNKDLLLLSITHCTNYYITMMTVAAI